MPLRKALVLLIVLQSLSSCACIKTISPLDFGLKDAKTDVERYEVLYNTHWAALKQNCGVSYSGISIINIEIPEGAKMIPITYYTDFAGITLNVTNRKKDNFFLFFLETAFNDISLTKEQFSSMQFDQIDELKEGKVLLVVEDQTPWVKKREGYDHGVTRRDIILIDNGKPKNSPIQPYSNDVSAPKFKYCKASRQRSVIKNLQFNRTSSSTCKTFLVKIVGRNDVLIDNVVVNTPQTDKLYADYAISIQNCTDVKLEDISINGTYSQKSQYGYGINLNNVWNSLMVRIKADANWGVFGNYNVNYARLEDCDINRFDVHCYGRDIYCTNTRFNNLYNQFSSIYGDVLFKNCVFIHFTPVLIEPSFNAYTPFELTWKGCVFYLDKKHNCLLDLYGPPKPNNERQELKRKNLPNITMKDCKVFLSDDLDKWFLVQTGSTRFKDSFDGITSISINGLDVENERGKEFNLFSSEIKTTNNVETTIIRK